MMATARFFLRIIVFLVPMYPLISCPKKDIWEQLVCELNKCEQRNRQGIRPRNVANDLAQNISTLNLYAHTIEDCIKMCSQEIQYFKKMLSQLNPNELERRDCQGFRLLDLAVQFRLLYHMRCLLEAGSNPNVSVPGHVTTLHHIISHAGVFCFDALTINCLDLLLSYGADINAGKKAVNHSSFMRSRIYQVQILFNI